MACYCYLRNILDLLSGGKTRRLGITFNGQRNPFWAMVEYNTFCAGHIEITSIWPKSLARYIPRLCIVCGENLEKATLWSQTLKKWRRWTHLNSTPEGSMSTPQRNGNFIFPFADGTVQIFGWEQRLRTSTLTRERLERGEEQEILQRNSDERYAPSHLQEDSTRDDEEVKNDFWAFAVDRYTSHVIFHAVCTFNYMHVTLHGSRRATQCVCVRASFHLHAIHDVCLTIRCLSLRVCLSLRRLPLLFFNLIVLCPALHLQCQ